MSVDYTKSFFDGSLVKNVVPEDIKYIVVSDFFANEVIGGAELTLEAILEKCPGKIHRVNSKNVTPELIKRYNNKTWIIGNFSQFQPLSIIAMVDDLVIQYHLIEFDFKYCAYRSSYRHLMETGKPCDCPITPHGIIVNKFFAKAKKVFWMSEKQKEEYTNIWPSLDGDKNIILSSVFTDKTLDSLKFLRLGFAESQEKKDQVWAIQASDSWIKGTEQTKQWAQRQNLSVKLLGGMSYDVFLQELAKSYGLIFRPSDSDTCPRVVIESYLLGLQLKLNNHVLHKDESWACGSIEDCDKYLRTRASYFWELV